MEFSVKQVEFFSPHDSASAKQSFDEIGKFPELVKYDTLDKWIYRIVHGNESSEIKSVEDIKKIINPNPGEKLSYLEILNACPDSV